MSLLVPNGPSGYAAEPQIPFRTEPHGVRLRSLLGMALQHRKLAMTVGAATFVVILGFFALQPRVYASSGTLVIDPKQQNLTAVTQQLGLPPDTSAVDTQVEILRSPALAEAVTRKLKLYNDPEFNPAMKPGLFGLLPAKAPLEQPSPQVMARVSAMVQNHAWARREGLTYVVRVGFKSASPDKARRIADAWLDAYLERQLADKLNDVTRANSELGASLERMRADAESTEAKVQEYKAANGLLSAEGATMAEQEVSSLNTQIAAAKAETAEKYARLAAAQRQLRNGAGGSDVGAALGSDTIKELRKSESETATKLAQLKADFLPTYPEVVRTEAQLTAIRGQIQAEINRILSSLNADAQAAAGRQASLLGSRGTAQGGLASNSRAQVGLLALQQRADAAKLVYEAYLNRAKDLSAQGALQRADGRISSPAVLPLSPASPNMKLAALLALLAAGVAGSGAVVAAELWDRSLRNRQAVERELGLRFAGVLPDAQSLESKRLRAGLGAFGGNPTDRLVDHPLSAFAESFRNLRAFLTFAAHGDDVRLIAVTSAVPREGKSVTSFGLARTLALSGARVVLVDCDLRQRGASRMAEPRQVDGKPVGLVEVVRGEVALEAALAADERTTLSILPASGRSAPVDLFSTPQSDALLRELAERFDYVILDTPPLLGMADARILAAKVDRVLYVVQWNKTPVRAAQGAVEILQECGATVAGAVLTRVDVAGQARFGYGDDSDYYGYFKRYYVEAA